MNRKYEIVDAHQHVGDMSNVLSAGQLAFGPERTFEEDVSRRVAEMDARGIAWAVLQPNHGYLKPNGMGDTIQVNDTMARYKRCEPDRFRGVFGLVEPTHGERSLAEIDRCKHELELDGIAWHHRFQGCYIDNKWMWPILERMAEKHMAAIVHVNAESSLESAWRLQRLASDFPCVPFIAFDGLWTFERSGEIGFRASQTPNVIWDIGGPANYLQLERWVERHGAENLCYSAGNNDQARQQVRSAEITCLQKEMIFGGNIKRALGL